MPDLIDKSELILVQYWMCTHTTYATRRRIEELQEDWQLDQIASGIKLDAVILPHSACPQCTLDRELVDRRNAEMDIGPYRPSLAHL